MSRSWHLRGMLISETVTFGGSGLDRAAHLRDNCAALSGDPEARTIVFWRGKHLADPNNTLVRLKMDHPILDEGSGHNIFLGKDKDQPLLSSGQLDRRSTGHDRHAHFVGVSVCGDKRGTLAGAALGPPGTLMTLQDPSQPS